MVQGLREAFPLRDADPSVARALSGEAGLKEPGPIFVVGLPRSGSTLIEQILASHPQVFGAGAPPLPCICSNCLPAECTKVPRVGWELDSAACHAIVPGVPCYWLLHSHPGII